jgi:DhnA family fructose-bisphosphate aldolase class Ia
MTGGKEASADQRPRGPEVGRIRRTGLLIPGAGRPTIVVPIDDSMLAGPTRDAPLDRRAVESISEGSPDGILGFSGQFARFSELLRSQTWIFNLTASGTNAPTHKVQIQSPSDAATMGADWVACHVNVGSRFESPMLETLGSVIAEAHRIGLPVLAIMYPRTETPEGGIENHAALRADDPEAYADLVAHAVRMAVDAGADAVKTQFTGTVSSFEWVVQSADTAPVLVAGGPLSADYSDIEHVARSAVTSGAAGISFGRNVWGRPDPASTIRSLRSTISLNV